MSFPRTRFLDASLVAEPLFDVSDPLGHGTTALAGSPEVRRLRVGDHRVIHTLENDRLIIWVVRVGHRSTAHE
ncbi:type II toxin-antitoxin system RelE/ParE family toxin [Nocardiopsis sp. B62]|uniref:type II toxin-antitoxin system RelE family toxin n=1 Tax=Nocardiopsis sp. B62 TaxID=2824874 RepID=UPI001B36F3CB|nr:type II toxin-antitoxin system RelE/ParE family toxin [Nocardiopsis sp. B62]MBQ1081094.1 type II toxin-antitoxin system RelE/ParE family toxin [Nocardiopsis sp. B62]